MKPDDIILFSILYIICGLFSIGSINHYVKKYGIDSPFRRILLVLFILLFWYVVALYSLGTAVYRGIIEWLKTPHTELDDTYEGWD